MRTNLPVTTHEVELSETSMIVSRTDLQGRLTYVNKDFLDISGFTEQELIGQPHNIVRHPDMPPEAFEDLWRDLKAGRPWVGYVKNRCKNGDFYWVEAHAAPIWEAGQITGYVSVRRKPSRENVAAAEGAYKLFRDGKAGSLRVEHGQVVKGSRTLRKLWRDMSMAARLALGFGLTIVLALSVSLTSYLTLESLRGQFSRLDDQIVARERIAYQGALALGDGIHHFKNALLRAGDYPAKFEQDMKAIDKAVLDYRAIGAVSAEEDTLLKGVTREVGSYREAMASLVAMQGAGSGITDIDKSIKGADKPLAEAFAHLRAYNNKLSQESASSFEETIASNERRVAIVSLLLLLAGSVAAWLIARSIAGPAGILAGVLREIAGGKSDNLIDVSRNDEIGKVLQGLDAMQNRLGFDLSEAHRVADEMTRIKIALDNVSTGVMIANGERTIIYTNRSVVEVLKGAEAAIRTQLPNFSADKLIGQNIDQFHKNPKHQADMLGALKTAYTAKIEIGGRHMVVSANPVINDKGERLGSVAEWQDRTLEVMTEQEVDGLVAAAAAGDLTQRIDTTGKSGFFISLGNGLNQLLENTSAALNATSEVLSRVAQGDLAQKIEADYEGIFGKLKEDTNATIERLREVVGQIKDSTELIDTAAKEIAAGNTDLSSRTEQQASSLEETASSMEELNSTVKQNAENAVQANQLARSSNDTAVKSGQMVQQIVSTMNGISDSSKKIADIIGVIDSIAFQTNILALNAAVEAARAGEQGRGFAVVATEVRNLAQRSATAAKEIKELIAESTGKVVAGTRLVDQAGVSMDEVVTSFRQVTGLVTDIANASREQASGIEQVTQAVGQMDEVTQQNAALVEQAAAAAESLEEQARSLVQAVSMFRLDARAPGRSAMAAQASHGVAPRSLSAGGSKVSTGGTASSLDFNAALAAHQAWKDKLRTFLVGKGDALDPAVVECDDKCTLGQWIHGPGRQIDSDQDYGELKSCHAEFHRSAATVIRRQIAGDTKAAYKELAGPFNQWTVKVVRQLTTLRDRYAGGTPPAASAASVAARGRLVKPAGDDEEWEEF